MLRDPKLAVADAAKAANEIFFDAPLYSGTGDVVYIKAIIKELAVFVEAYEKAYKERGS